MVYDLFHFSPHLFIYRPAFTKEEATFAHDRNLTVFGNYFVSLTTASPGFSRIFEEKGSAFSSD